MHFKPNPSSSNKLRTVEILDFNTTMSLSCEIVPNLKKKALTKYSFLKNHSISYEACS